MAVKEKQLYLRGGSRLKIEPCLYMEFNHVQVSVMFWSADTI